MGIETQSQSDLLAVGSGTYLDALAAIAAFEQEAEDLCRDAYDRQKQRLLLQMGLETGECDRHKFPSPEDREAEIGVCRPAQKGYKFYIYLWWKESASGLPEAVCAVALDLSTKTIRDDIWNRFHHNNPRCHVCKEVGNTYFLFLTAPINLSKRSAASETLDRLVSEWIGYCESVGGLKLSQK